MKQHEYMLRIDKDVFEGEQTPVHYHIEISTNNYQCHKDLANAVYRIINDYQEMEVHLSEGELCDADEQYQSND